MLDLADGLDLRGRRDWRTAKNTLMTCVLGACVLAVAIPLALIVYAVVHKGAGVAFKAFPSFFSHDVPIVSRKAGPGMGPAIIGTLLVTFGATAIAVPLGILGAIFLHEYGQRSKFAKLVRFMAMVMTG